jgi:hypothetical protein
VAARPGPSTAHPPSPLVGCGARHFARSTTPSSASDTQGTALLSQARRLDKSDSINCAINVALPPVPSCGHTTIIRPRHRWIWRTTPAAGGMAPPRSLRATRWRFLSPHWSVPQTYVQTGNELTGKVIKNYEYTNFRACTHPILHQSGNRGRSSLRCLPRSSQEGARQPKPPGPFRSQLGQPTDTSVTSLVPAYETIPSQRLAGSRPDHDAVSVIGTPIVTATLLVTVRFPASAPGTTKLLMV